MDGRRYGARGYGAGYSAYDDTNGHSIYHLANFPTTWRVDKWGTLLPGTNDGVVDIFDARASVGGYGHPFG